MKLRNSQKQETIVTERKTKSKVYRKYQIDATKEIWAEHRTRQIKALISVRGGERFD